MKRMPLLFALLFGVLAISQAQTATDLPKPAGKVTPPIVLKVGDVSNPPNSPRGRFEVIVFLRVDEMGMPTHVVVTKSDNPVFNASAIDSVKHYRFKPAMQDGKPVASDLYVDVSFDTRN
jgi:protein TonB